MSKTRSGKGTGRRIGTGISKAMPATSEPAPTRGKPGRPPRISREAVLRYAMEILATTPVEEFKLKTVTDQLGTVPMSIYNYFNNREALLMAVADEVCLLFKPPKPAAAWQKTLTAWLWALKKHADAYPVMPSILGLNGHSSTGWVKMIAPIVVLMREQLGLRGKRLATATYLFATTAISMIRIVKLSADYMQPSAFPRLEALQPIDDRELDAVLEIQKAMPTLKEKLILDALFAQLVAGVEILI